MISQKQKKMKKSNVAYFNSKLFETKLTESADFFTQKINDSGIDSSMVKGFKNFLKCFDDFLENIIKVDNVEDYKITIYGGATLENGTKIRATNNYHNRPWFSNVAISMNPDELNYKTDEGLCYGKILLMTKIEMKENSSFNLALVQWYDFKFQKNPFLYNCPLLKLVELYNFITIETIDDVVHIISRFEKNNEYFVNKYLF
jgi:hypothetical protein